MNLKMHHHAIKNKIEAHFEIYVKKFLNFIYFTQNVIGPRNKIRQEISTLRLIIALTIFT